MTETNSIFLRDSLNYDPSNPQKRNNLVALSPDILPLYQTEVTTVDSLTETYGSFVAQTVVPEEDNFVYIRGCASDTTKPASATFTVCSVTNEIILWPQVLKAAAPIGNPISLSYQPDTTGIEDVPPGVTASLKSLDFKPENQGARYDALVAYTGDNAISELPDAANYNDLLSGLGASANFGLLNAQIADPIFDTFTWSTRLRFFDDSNTPIKLEIDIEALGVPAGFEVSMYSSDPGLSLANAPIVSGQNIGTTVSVTNNYDSLVTIQITRTDPTAVLADYASVSIVAGVTTISTDHLELYTMIGAEHLLFNEQIRTSRMLQQSKVKAQATANGFYFRDKLGDTDSFPRTGATGASPDIQPYGTIPDPNFPTDFPPSNYNVDISDKRGAAANILPASANYIYLRGNADQYNTQVETSLYAIPCNLLIYPANYGQHAITDVDTSGNTVTAIRDATITTPGPIAIDNPFNFFNPTDPKALGSDHYCLIAEARPYVADPNDKPLWPHQVTLSSGADITNWILNQPCVCQRNVCFMSNPNSPTQVWECNVTIPAEYPANSQWTMKLDCANMPVGGAIAMSATGDLDINVNKTTISNPNMSVGVDFTGVVGPYSMTVTLSWWQGTGGPIPPSATTPSSLSAILQLNVQQNAPLSQISGAKKRSPSENFDLIVGPGYPNLASNKKQLKGSGKPQHLLGKAHPIKELAAAGTHPNILTQIQIAIQIGGDTKRFN